MKKILIALTAIASLYAHAQKFEVSNVHKVATSTEAYHPIFTPDGKQILVSSEAYNGLGVINLSTGAYKELTNARSAGYYPAISADGKTVICRNFDEMAYSTSLLSIDIENGNIETLATGLHHFNHININNKELMVGIDGRKMKKAIRNGNASTSNNDLFVTEEDLKVVLYNGDERTVIDPLSTPEKSVNYCWSSLSPDKQHLLFVGGNHAYVCDLDGGNLVNLGKLHAPVWRDNQYVVGMHDTDDGSRYLTSEIEIVDINGNNRQQLSTSSAEIKMFPAVSADGSTIAYHTLEGNIYLMNIKEK